MISMTSPRLRFAPVSSNAEVMEARLALRITSVLSEGARHLPHDVTERLRFAREQAIRRAGAVAATVQSTAGTVHVQSNGASTLGAGRQPGQRGAPIDGWWLRFASLLPLVALLAGLVLIQDMHANSQISAAAEVDSELLADEVPPTAYSDPGFVEFLKTPSN